MLQKLTPVVKNLIIINVLFYLATWAFGMSSETPFPKLYDLLAGYYPASGLFKPWQIVTHMFMHSHQGFMHIFFNMFALYMFGTALERAWGPKRFLQFYLVCGLGAFALYEFTVGLQVYQLTGSFAPETVPKSMLSALRQLYYTPVVGASGAIFGILLGFGMLFPNTQLMLLFPPIPIKAKWFVLIYGAIELFGGFNQLGGAADNVAHFAHLGGMLFGFLMIRYWKSKKTFD